jgi:hypothetical protein
MSVCPATLTTTSKDNAMTDNELPISELEELITLIDIMLINDKELI